MPRALAILSLLAFAAALAQHTYGIGIWKTIPIEDIRPDSGHAFKTKLPDEFARPLDDARGFVTEDGEVTGRRAGSNATVRDHGRGWFKILRGHARFSATDNTDPKTNGRAYAVKVPRPVPLTLLYGLLALSAAAVTFAFRQGDKSKKIPDTAHDRFWIPKQKSAIHNTHTAIFLIATVVGAALIHFGSGYTDQGLTVKGMPYSDALGWNEMAIALAEGRGFTTDFATHRPFYSVFLGVLYNILGPHLVIAKIVNALAAGLLAASAFLLASRAFRSTAAGVALAAFLVLAPAHIEMLQITATEQLGLAFTVFSVYLTWSAFITRRPSLFLAAGLFLGLANLTRTFTVLAFPLYGLVLIIFYIVVRPGWLKFLGHVALFAGGVILVFGPWIARQKVSHDILSVSSNSADLLYGAAAYGRWDARQYEEAEAAGIDPKPENNPVRHPFFNSRLIEVIEADPERYDTFVKARLVEYFAASFDPSDPAFRLTAALAALGAALTLCIRRRSPAGLIALALFLPAFAYVTEPNILTLNLPVADTGSDLVPVPLIYPEKPTPAGGLILLCAAIPLAFLPANRNRVIAASLLVVTLLGSAVLSASVGNFGLARTGTFGDWIYVALILAAITGLFQLTGMILNKIRPVPTGDPEPQPEVSDPDPDDDLPPPPPHRDGFAITTAYLIVFVSLLGITLMGLEYLGRLGKETPTTWQLPEAEVAKIQSWAGSKFSAEIAANPNRPLTVAPIILGDYRADLAAGEDVAHWSMIFEVRDIPRTVAKVRSGADPATGDGGSLLPVQFPGLLPEDLPQRKPYALVGLRNDLTARPKYIPGRESVQVEALALVPLTPEGVPDFERATLFAEVLPNPSGG